MADQAITALPKKTYSGSSQIASTDYLLGIDSAEGYQMLIQDLGEYIINRATASLAGSTQTLASAISALNSNMWKKASVTIPAGQTKSLVAGREEISCFISTAGPQASIRAGLYYLSGYTTSTRVTLIPLNASPDISFDMTNETTVTIPITNSSANPVALTVFVLRKTGSDITFQ